MMRKGWLVAVCVAALSMTIDSAQAGGHVYALRGLINVFSQGMDAMVDKCRERGIHATVHGHGEYVTLAPGAAMLAKSGKGPIIIVGHSLGADAAVYMAEEMNKLGAPVALLVLFSPTVDLPIPPNVRQVFNYYQSSSLWRGQAIKGPGFKGSIRNVNLVKAEDVTHFNIEKIDRLHDQTLTRITTLTGRGRPLPAVSPAVPASDPTENAGMLPSQGTATAKPTASSGQRNATKRPAAAASGSAVVTPLPHGVN